LSVESTRTGASPSLFLCPRTKKRDPKVALKPGDVVEVRVEGISTLTNPVVADED